MRHHLHRGLWLPDRRVYRGPLGGGGLMTSMGGTRFVASTATLMLDETGLGSAACAVSWCRKLRAAHGGSCYRLRRSTDNAELDIGFSGNLSDDAAALAHCGAGDGFIVTAYDQSGNGRNPTQADTTKQPKIISAGAFITGANSKPAALFDGSNDFLRVAYTLAQPVTLSVVSKQVTWTADDRVWDGGATNAMGLLQHGASPQLFTYAGAGYANSNTGWTLGTWALLTAIYSGAASVLEVNAGTDATGNPGTSTTGGICIGAYGSGGGAWANISLQEFVIWPSALAAGARTTQRADVNAFYLIY